MIGSSGGYKSYQSVESAYKSGQTWQGENMQTPTVQHPRKRHHRFLFKKKEWLVGCVLVLLVVAIASYAVNSAAITEEERDIAAINGLPYSWSTVQEIRKAQNVADLSRDRLLNSESGSSHDTDAEQVTFLAGWNGIQNSFFRGKTNQDVVDSEPTDDQERTQPPSPSFAPTKDCESTIIILRHCEKGRIREHCAYVGYERSVYLSTLFGDGNERWPSPSYIFALGPGSRRSSRKMNFREIETVGPLREKVGIPVDDSFSIQRTGHLAAELVQRIRDENMCGKIAVISWKHSNIGHLAHLLGCGPAQGCPLRYTAKTFDEAWQIKFVRRDFMHSASKTLKLHRLPEWKVFGSVQPENFDPLAFSKLVGDYPARTANNNNNPNLEETRHQPVGGWQSHAVEIPERKSPNDTDDWFLAQNIDFLASTPQGSAYSRSSTNV
ncbi:hypothetical protein ACA910_017518 [Epithemia clementina (nom. ined.)]